MKENYNELIEKYLEGKLTAKQEKEVEALLISGEIDADCLKSTKLYDHLRVIETPQPSENLRKRFYTHLETEQNNSQSISLVIQQKWNNFIQQLTLPKVGYAAVLLFIGGFVGSISNNSDQEINSLSTEVQTLKEMMIVSMLEGASTTDRLKAVHISAELPVADKKAVHALLFTLNNDESVNVRVQTIETLKKWGKDADVREGLVNAIRSEQSEIVLIALADAMIELELKNSKEQLQDLITTRPLSMSVEEKIKNTISAL